MEIQEMNKGTEKMLVQSVFSKCKGVSVALIFKSVVIKESEQNLKLYLFLYLFLLFHIRRILRNDNTSWCLLLNLSPTNKWLYSIKWGQSTCRAWLQNYYLWYHQDGSIQHRNWEPEDTLRILSSFLFASSYMISLMPEKIESTYNCCIIS